MTTINIMALAVCVVLYLSVYATTWQDRYLARLTAGTGLLLILAITI
jgi:multisubunit Na+/H+ antiporter MnhF subunit